MTEHTPEDEREYSIYKDNRLIQNITRRKYELSVLEQKVLCYILSKIRPNRNGNIVDQPEYEYTFEINQFCKVCGIDSKNGKNYIDVKAALERLADNAFWLDYGEGEFRFQWIVSPDIKRRSGLIEIEIPKKVMPFLYGLSEKFTSYQLYQILALKSSYSIALYELFKSHAYKKNVIISIRDLRKYLSLEDKYREYKEFRRVVLQPALKEIDQYTDITVNFTPIRNGRRYAALDFSITMKDSWDGLEAYSRTMAEINGMEHIPGQINLFE